MPSPRRLLVYSRAGVSAARTFYRQNQSLRGVAARLWFIARREGLGGLRVRIIGHAKRYSGPDERYELSNYRAWAERYGSLGPEQVDAACRHAATLDLPEVLILQVVTTAAFEHRDRIRDSWAKSIHPAWRVGLVAAAGLSQAQQDELGRFAAADSQLELLSTPDGIAERAGRFSHVLLCFGAVLLNELTLYALLEAATRTGAVAVSADHDHLDREDRRCDPVFKPRFSPEYARQLNYLGDVVLASPSAGALRAADLGALAEGSLQAFDGIVSRAVSTGPVEHCPFVLFHARERQRRIARPAPEPPRTGPLVSVVIPTRDGLKFLKPCIESIITKTRYDLDRVQLLVVDNGSERPETLSFLRALAERSGRPSVRIVAYPHPFNFSAINNAAVRESDGAILVFLNNDTEVLDPDWLGKLVRHASEPDVGAVGAKLLYRDGTIQHGGCAVGAAQGTVQHLLVGAPAKEVEASDVTREMSVVTAACLAVRREVFNQVGGFDPVLRVAWNDVELCLACATAGFRNIYVADALLIHDESRTRGSDDAGPAQARLRGEVNYTRRRFPAFFRDDPSYSPNLSLETAGRLAVPPRVARPWLREAGPPVRILMLSVVYDIGFGVPVVMAQQAGALLTLGYEVVLGGPEGRREMDFPGCRRVVLGSAKAAAAWAFRNDVRLVICHTPPFFEVPVWIGPHIKVLSYDYGEPSPEFFPDPTASYLRDVERAKRFAAPLATGLAAISQAVKDEAPENTTTVVALANSHLACWSEALRPTRYEVRRRLGWTGRFVVLTVCRFGVVERSYKGLDRVAEIIAGYPYLHPERSQALLWVLAGRGSPEDQEAAEALGFTVFPNISDATLAELYAAADAFVSFSRWEGYNLGIGQALAMGLPTLASDIPAHRAFPIATTNSLRVACNWLAGEVEAGTAAGPGRQAVVVPWEESTSRFAVLVEQVLHDPGTGSGPRAGIAATVATEPAA